MSLGKTVKHIRKTKNIKLKHICGNTIDMGNYWRFEEGRISVSADTFYQIIHNLNISLDEFAFYHSNYQPDKLQQLGKQMISAYQVLDKKKLEEIASLALNEYNQTQQIKYQHLYFVSTIYIDSINKQTINPNHTEPLKDYLMNCEQWGYYEVSLFNNILFIFGDLDIILALYKRMDKSFLRSTPLHRTPNEESLLATNIMTMCLHERAFSKAMEINSHIQALEVGERSMFARTLQLWSKGLINKVVLNKDEGLDQIITSLKIMETLEMTSTLKMFERWKSRLI